VTWLLYCSLDIFVLVLRRDGLGLLSLSLFLLLAPMYSVRDEAGCCDGR
jgi:hypothetical protein